MSDITITIPAARIESVACSIMENVPECSTGLTCIRYRYEEWDFPLRR